MKFSICIPNYNYAEYIGRTLESVLAQEGADFEIVIADNASTDRSVEVIESFQDARIRLRVNACNVGFAGNLDKAASMAKGDVMIMLSSDDLVSPGALGAYSQVFDALGAAGTVVTAKMNIIDPSDARTGEIGRDEELWAGAEADPRLEDQLGAPVWVMAAHELLRRSIARMRNPLNFAATAYPRGLYQRVEGYGGGRLINPDKWFHWRLLATAERAVFVDAPLFSYRWHPRNQTAQQSQQGALKYLVDEYASVLELEAGLLDRVSLTRSEVEQAFVEYDIARHGLATLARGERLKARRILDFGRATYPQHVRRNLKARALSALLAAGVGGESIASLAYAVRSRSLDAGARG